MEPATAIIASTLIATAANVGSAAYGSRRQKKAQKKAQKLRAKETKRETFAELLDQAHARKAELEGMRLSSHEKLGKRKAQSLMDTAATMREAFNNV